MSTARVLHCLYTGDTSLDLLDHLRYLIRYDEKEQYLISLQGSELTQLVDFLDKVHVVPSAFHQFTKQILQVLGAVTRTDDVARECLNKLQAICGHHATLPSSYIVSGPAIARVGDHPITLGGIADVWEGTYRGEKVSIKTLRVCMKNHKAIKKVCILYNTFYRVCSRTPVGLAVTLQRSHHVEEVKTPKHRPFRWCHDESFASCFGVDAKRKSDGVRREISSRKSDQPGQSLLVITLNR